MSDEGTKDPQQAAQPKAKKSAKYDPVEEMKGHESAPKPQAPAPAQVAAPEAPPKDPTPRAPQKYRVRVGKQVSIRGALTFLPAGHMVTTAGYDRSTIEQIKLQGVDMEAVQ